MSINLFGRSYESAGSSNADFLIKTKGKVKIQYGSKFIDLIKDGKINADAKFIYKEKEVGVKDGIYVIGDGEESRVILLVNGNQIDLKGEIGTTYVSFLGEQKTTSDNKYTALTNIGFIYKDLDSISDDSLKNGLIYVESEKKLYVISDGQLSEYVVNIPNPYTKQFVIAKESSEEGAIVIQGEGKENSLSFDSLLIYQKDSESYIDSKGDIKTLINGQQKILIKEDIIVFATPVSSSMFQSFGASQANGFRLYDNGSESTLEVDNLVVRKTQADPTKQALPQYWYKLNNVILSIEPYVDDSVGETDSQYTLGLEYAKEFKVGDELKSFAQYVADSVTVLRLIPLVVVKVNTNNSVVVKIDQSKLSLTSIEEIGEDNLLNGLLNQIIFLTKRASTIIPEIGQEGFSITQEGVHTTKIGVLDSLNLKVQEETIQGSGTYTEKSFAKKASYIDGYELGDKDKSPNFASTEWVQKYINNLLPSGSIIMFNGQADSIPEGWAICNGQNGTPNLVGKFVKASSTAGETGGKTEIALTLDNLPKHSHSIPANSGSTSSDGSHSHTSIGIDVSTIEVQEGEGTTVVSKVSTTNQSTSSNGDHSYSVSVSASNTGYVGSGTPLKWEPTYYSLIYIMKL